MSNMSSHMLRSLRAKPLSLPGFAGLLFLIAVALVCAGCGAGGDYEEFLSVGIPTSRMTDFAAEQIGQNWCWAASIQMVLSTKGVRCDQPEIVRQTFGNTADLPGSTPQIAERLTGWFDTRSGRMLLVASPLEGPPQPGLLHTYLRNRTPIILAVTYPGAPIGHAVVATGAVFRINEAGLFVEKVLVRDPSPAFAATNGKRELTAGEYSNTMAHIVLDVVKKR